jgi:hypothetical protein
MSPAVANLFNFNLLLIGIGLLMLVVGVDKHVFAWKRRRCPSCGRAHDGGCRRYGS